MSNNEQLESNQDLYPDNAFQMINMLEAISRMLDEDVVPTVPLVMAAIKGRANPNSVARIVHAVQGMCCTPKWKWRQTKGAQ